MKTNILFLVLIAFIASLGGFLFGFDTGVINGTQLYFSDYFSLEASAKGWVVGSALVGCFIGAIVAGEVSRRLGRKTSLIISAALFTLSAWGSGLPSFLPQTVNMLVVFRIIGGLGIGIASMNAPTYISELAPAKMRGFMVTIYQFAIVSGFVTVFYVTYNIGADRSVEENIQEGWRWMFWSELIPCAAFLGLLFLVPRSPRWLAMQGRDAEAKKVLSKIHGEQEATKELAEIHQSIATAQNVSFGVALKKPLLAIVVIGTVLSMLQQFTGINAVLYYGGDIFEQALNIPKEDVLRQNLIVAIVNFGATIIAMATVDKLGRKPLIYMGSLGMFAGFAMLGGSLYFEQVGLISLVGVLLFIGSFALSMGPVVWVVLSEMFPNNLRNVAMSIAVAGQWAANYFVSQMFPIVAESETNNSAPWNGSMPYIIFMIFIVIIFVFTRKYIPETKGKTLEEMEQMWTDRAKA